MECLLATPTINIFLPFSSDLLFLYLYKDTFKENNTIRNISKGSFRKQNYIISDIPRVLFFIIEDRKTAKGQKSSINLTMCVKSGNNLGKRLGLPYFLTT